MTKSKPNDTPLRVLYEKIHVVFAVTNDLFTIFVFFRSGGEEGERYTLGLLSALLGFKTSAFGCSSCS